MDSFTTAIMAKPIGRSIIVVEVFMIHMLNTQELSINPPIIDFPLVPVYFKTFNAMRL